MTDDAAVLTHVTARPRKEAAVWPCQARAGGHPSVTRTAEREHERTTATARMETERRPHSHNTVTTRYKQNVIRYLCTGLST